MLVSENPDANQPHHRRNVIAIVLQVRKCLAHDRRRSGHRRNIQVQAGAIDQLFKKFGRNFEFVLRVAQCHQHRIIGCLAGKDRFRGFQPFAQLLALLLRINAGFIGNIIGVAHEGVHRA